MATPQNIAPMPNMQPIQAGYIAYPAMSHAPVDPRGRVVLNPNQYGYGGGQPAHQGETMYDTVDRNMPPPRPRNLSESPAYHAAPSTRNEEESGDQVSRQERVAAHMDKIRAQQVIIRRQAAALSELKERERRALAHPGAVEVRDVCYGWVC